jgi:hypothetical protein
MTAVLAGVVCWVDDPYHRKGWPQEEEKGWQDRHPASKQDCRVDTVRRRLGSWLHWGGMGPVKYAVTGLYCMDLSGLRMDR